MIDRKSEGLRKLGQWASVYLRNALQSGPRIGNILLIGIPVILAELIFLYYGSYLRLDFSNPTVITMFTAHYTHQNLMHMTENIKLFIPLMIGVIVLERRCKRVFYLICGIFFLVLPFTLSAIDMLFVKYTGFTSSAGLSGINAALLGYFIYLVVEALHDFLINQEYTEHNQIMWWNVDKFLVVAFVMVMFVPIISIVQYAMFPQMNPVVHIGGYILGFLIPPLVGMTQHRDWLEESIAAIACILMLPIFTLILT